uniref:Uncharacterized protein n=1 Tax=Caenorhabditis japonica TaxID=281687 RepID=A0A8R1EFU9_CAEJA
NVYSVEIHNPPNEPPRFIGVTQTSFCHPIFGICPITVNTFENVEDSADDLFNNSSDEDEEEDDEEEKKKHVKVKRYFIAIGKQSMVELQMTLKQHTPTPPSTVIDSSSSDEKTSEGGGKVFVDTSGAAGIGGASPGLLMQVVPPLTTSSSNLDAVNQKLDDVLAYLVRVEEERKASQEVMVEQIVARLEKGIEVAEKTPKE